MRKVWTDGPVCGFDLESRSLVDLKARGLFAYAEDSSTEVMCFAYAFDDGEPSLWRWGDDLPDDLADHIKAGGLFSAWNAQFDVTVWNHVMRRDYGAPKIEFAQAIDSMAHAAAANLPQSLDQCARQLGLPEDKQKDKRGKYLIQRLCKPRTNRKTGQKELFFDEELFQELCDYCEQDVVVERQLYRMIPKLSEFEQRVWVLTQEINARGIPLDVDGCNSIIRVTERETERLNLRAAEITNHEVPAVTQRAKLVEWANGRGVPINSVAAEAMTEILQWDLPDDVREVLEIRNAVCQTSVAKFPKMLEIASADGSMRGLQVYHGAATGRFASRGGLNIQNLVRYKIKDVHTALQTLTLGDWGVGHILYGDDLMDAAVSCTRGMLKAPEGMIFRDADFSSIENRVGVWLADHRAKIRMFEEGLDEYRVFASTSLFGVPYDEVTGEQRQFSKAGVLGCLFGQGSGGLALFAKGYGVDLSEERSAEVVRLYREDYAPVKELWYACGDAAMSAVKNPGAVFRAGKYLRFKCTRNFLVMRLPSGRLLRWYKPRVEMAETPWGEMRPVVTAMGINTFTRQWCRNKIIGSSFFQSAVQGTARDLLVNAMFALEDEGYPIVTTIHDEILSLTEENFGSVREMEEIMSRPVEWAPGLPLAAEGWEGVRFRK